MSAYDKLQYHLCVDLGFCGSDKHVDDYLPDVGMVTADQFVAWLYEAEGFPVDYALDNRARELRRLIRAAFVEYMGAESVDVERLK